jgi:Biotin/lipoate A/B protein ligase family.
MEMTIPFFNNQRWRVIDQTTLGPHMDPLVSYAIDDMLCESVGEGHSPATARLWVHDRQVALGIQDTRLPRLAEGLRYLKEEGYGYQVRTSGGLAVPLDGGIINITLVFPERSRSIQITEGYETMYRVIKEMFPEEAHRILRGEVHGSYCPGSYDLSIDGKKFAGISQRRLKKGVAVQIYLCFQGSGEERGKLIRNFYLRARGDEPVSFPCPDVRPEVMASLSERLGENLTLIDMVAKFYRALERLGTRMENGSLDEYEQRLFERYYERVAERNEKWLPPRPDETVPE